MRKEREWCEAVRFLGEVAVGPIVSIRAGEYEIGIETDSGKVGRLCAKKDIFEVRNGLEAFVPDVGMSPVSAFSDAAKAGIAIYG
jgi:hypothetical protein